MTGSRPPDRGGGGLDAAESRASRRTAPVRRARLVGVAGAVWAVVAAGYLLSRWVDETTVSILHNPAARRADLGWGVLALVIGMAALAALLRTPPRALRVVLPLAALGYGVTTALALNASARRDRLASDLLFSVAPTLLMVVAAVILVAAMAHHPVRVAVEAAAVVAVVSVLLGTTLLRDPTSEARVFAGLVPHWQVERAVDNVFVDDAGTAWGVRPWALAETATLYRLDGGRFERVADREDGWPPTVVGTLAGGATVMVLSERDDPFEPVFEVHRDGKVERLPAPDPPLPPLDAVAVDPATGRVFGLHSDFAVPARAVLEIYDDGRWETVETPLEHSGRVASVDAGVDPRGRLWVWHDGDPATIHRYDEGRWTSVRLPFRARSATDVDEPPLTMDPFDTFLHDRRGALWLLDADADRLVTLGRNDEVVAGPELPADCVPVALDRRQRVWCRYPGGLGVVGPDGEDVYDTRRSGLPSFDVESVAVADDRAWVRVQRGRAEELLRFDHATVLGNG